MDPGEIIFQWLGFVYIFSALISAVIYPILAAAAAKKDVRGRYSKERSLKYHMTYGHIFAGIIYSLIPVLNTKIVVEAIVEVIVGTYNALNNKKIFEYKKDE